VTPPGSGNKKKRSHGSHVSSILGRKAHNGTIKTFVPQCAQIPHLTPSGSHVSSFLFRKAHNGTMKTFVPQGTKWYNENICYRKAHNGTMKTFVIARRHKFPPKSPYLTPEGSHVSSLLGRKAHNGTMKTFVPQGAQWQNENIYYRKAAKCFFIPSCPWRQHSMNMRPLWGRFLHSPTARRSIFFV
jgi:hypothetical protein